MVVSIGAADQPTTSRIARVDVVDEYNHEYTPYLTHHTGRSRELPTTLLSKRHPVALQVALESPLQSLLPVDDPRVSTSK